MTQTEANLAVAFRALCKQALSLLESWLLLVHVEETVAVLTTLALQELSPHVIYLDVVRPLLACRIRTHSVCPPRRTGVAFHRGIFDDGFDRVRHFAAAGKDRAQLARRQSVIPELVRGCVVTRQRVIKCRRGANTSPALPHRPRSPLRHPTAFPATRSFVSRHS
jgi:hypothetical protein